MDFKLAAPGVDWLEQFGSEDAGGGVGLTLRNSVELDMSEYLPTYHQNNLYNYRLKIHWKVKRHTYTSIQKSYNPILASNV